MNNSQSYHKLLTLGCILKKIEKEKAHLKKYCLQTGFQYDDIIANEGTHNSPLNFLYLQADNLARRIAVDR